MYRKCNMQVILKNQTTTMCDQEFYIVKSTKTQTISASPNQWLSLKRSNIGSMKWYDIHKYDMIYKNK